MVSVTALPSSSAERATDSKLIPRSTTNFWGGLSCDWCLTLLEHNVLLQFTTAELVGSASHANRAVGIKCFFLARVAELLFHTRRRANPNQQRHVRLHSGPFHRSHGASDSRTHESTSTELRARAVRPERRVLLPLRIFRESTSVSRHTPSLAQQARCRGHLRETDSPLSSRRCVGCPDSA